MFYKSSLKLTVICFPFYVLTFVPLSYQGACPFPDIGSTIHRPQGFAIDTSNLSILYHHVIEGDLSLAIVFLTSK